MRLSRRAHHVGTLTSFESAHAAPGGGIDLDLPGDGVRLRATRWPGRSDTHGPPVLLVHGLSATRRYWNLVAPDLRPLPVLALDARGHGDSGKPGAGYGLEVVADDAATALDALGLSRVLVVGQSWGGAVALTLAARHPERVLGVVAIEGGFVARRAAAERTELRARLRPPQQPVPAGQLEIQLRAGPLGAVWSPSVAAAVLPAYAAGSDATMQPRLSAEVHRQLLDSLLDYDPAAVLPQVAVACWLVGCFPTASASAPQHEPDDWSEAKAAGLAAASTLLPRPRLMRWYGAIHDVPLQWPALVTGLIRAAADEVAGGGK